MDKFPPVLILAGGLGTRIRDHFPETPKYLVPINGEPFALHQLRLLKKMGFNEIILCVGHKKEPIQKLISDGKQLGLNIRYSEDDENSAGTGGAIKKAAQLVSSPFCVIYGDSYLEFDFQPVYKAFLASKKKALMTVFHNKNELGKSNVGIKDGKIIKFDKENQSSDMEYIDFGFSLFSADAFHELKDTSFDLSKIIKILISKNELENYIVNYRFYEVGSINGIDELGKHLARKK